MSYDPIAHGARCDVCPLNKARLAGEVTPVPPSPARGVVRLIVVTEAPTRTEEKQGVMLSGRGGGLLKPLLAKQRVSMRDTHVTPAALCRSESDKDADSSARCCAPRLLRELAHLPPTAPILTLGKHALVGVLGVTNLLVARGFIWSVPRIKLATVKALERQKPSASPLKDTVRHVRAETLRWRRKLRGRVVFPTTALSFILRADTWAVTLRIDIRRMGRWLASGGLPHEDEAEYVVWPGSKGAA